MSNVIKVGIFASLALALLAYLILKAEDLELFGPEGQRIEAVFDSVAGLDDRAPVRVAGVRVGRVDGIRLDGARARVTLLLETPIELREGARAAVSNLGLLGDKYVEVDPGTGPGLWPEGEPLPGSSPVSIDRAVAKIESLGSSFEKVLGSLAEGEDGGGLGRLLDELTGASSALRELVEANRDEVSTTVGNFESFSETLARELPRLADQMQAVLAEIGTVVQENRGDLREGMSGLRELSQKAQVTADNLAVITDRLANGEGSLGKLLQSDEAHDGLTATLDSVRTGVEDLTEMLGKAERIHIDLGLQSAYLADIEDYRTEFQVEIDTETSRYYRLGLVKDPRGSTRRKTRYTTVTLPDGSEETVITETIQKETKATVSGLFGFRTSPKTRLWAGVIENEFGIEAELALASDRFRLAVEAFDFNRDFDLDPHLRFTTRWNAHPKVYLIGGWDDPLVDEFSSYFLGGGVRWNDDDLRYILGLARGF